MTINEMKAFVSELHSVMHSPDVNRLCQCCYIAISKLTFTLFPSPITIVVSCSRTPWPVVVCSCTTIVRHILVLEWEHARFRVTSHSLTFKVNNQRNSDYQYCNSQSTCHIHVCTCNSFNQTNILVYTRDSFRL